MSCVAIVDPETNERWLLDCTPDFRDQLRLLDSLTREQSHDVSGLGISGILPTHAHIGHYTGLMQLGREVLGARSVPVFSMPRMKYFLESNGPWSQLVELNQIRLVRIAAAQEVKLNARLHVTPFLVPHRDEFSETVGFVVAGPSRTLVYLPDIDKWERWETRIEDLIADCDIALLDGTFFDASELPGRNMNEIPHPFVRESLERFSTLPDQERSKVHFLHLNHSNPLHQKDSKPRQELFESGMHVAEQGQRFGL